MIHASPAARGSIRIDENGAAVAAGGDPLVRTDAIRSLASLSKATGDEAIA
jgi:hypothetical protein